MNWNEEWLLNFVTQAQSENLRRSLQVSSVIKMYIQYIWSITRTKH